MNSLALINEFLGQPPNASSHGYQIDHIIEFCHWFMAALFVGWSAFLFTSCFGFGRVASRLPIMPVCAAEFRRTWNFSCPD